MPNFDEMLAAQAAKPRPYKDVPVCLDADLADKREALLDELEEARAKDESDVRLSGPSDAHSAPIVARLDELTAAAQDSLITLRFRQLPGREWAALTLVHPVRVESPLDRQYGYNVDAVVAAAAAYVGPGAVSYGFRLDGDEEVVLSPTQWASLFDVLTGSEIVSIRDAIWGLNEWEPEQRIQALVKASGAAARSENQ